MQAAEKILNECKTAFDQDKRLWSIKKRLYNIEYVYYLQSKQYPKALEAAKKQEAEELNLSEICHSARSGETQCRKKGINAPGTGKGDTQ